MSGQACVISRQFVLLSFFYFASQLVQRSDDLKQEVPERTYGDYLHLDSSVTEEKLMQISNYTYLYYVEFPSEYLPRTWTLSIVNTQIELHISVYIYCHNLSQYLISCP
jgi:hypothetical protein